MTQLSRISLARTFPVIARHELESIQYPEILGTTSTIPIIFFINSMLFFSITTKVFHGSSDKEP